MTLNQHRKHYGQNVKNMLRREILPKISQPSLQVFCDIPFCLQPPHLGQWIRRKCVLIIHLQKD